MYNLLTDLTTSADDKDNENNTRRLSISNCRGSATAETRWLKLTCYVD